MFASKSPKFISSQITLILVTVLLQNVHQATGSFPSSWKSSDRCTYHYDYECGPICVVTCYQYQNSNILKSWPAIQLGGVVEVSYAFVRGSGGNSSFIYVDSFDNTEYRCSHGSLKNEVLLLKELTTGVTSSTTEAQCETLGVDQLNTRILPKFGTPGDADTLGKTTACPVSGEFSMEYVSGGSVICSFTDGGKVNFTADHFHISFCAGADQNSKIVNGFVLDSTNFFCVESFPGDFINGDNSTALVFYNPSSETYRTTKGTTETRYQYRGARYSYDGRGSYNFSMNFGANESYFMHEQIPTTTGADYATFRLYNCPNYECPGETQVCLLESEKCNGVSDCADGSDELNCDCCKIPSSHVGKWYTGRDNLEVAGNRQFFLHTVAADGCSLSFAVAQNDPTNNPPNTLIRKCGRTGETINGQFYMVDILVLAPVFWRCSSSFVTPNGELRFEKVSTDLASFSATSYPQECANSLGNSTNFLLNLKLPLINSTNPVSVPWVAEDEGRPWQTVVKQTSGSDLCTGDASSTITFTSDSINLKLCQNTGIPAASDIKETDVSLRVIRTWSGSDMAGLGKNSLGTFLLLGLNDQAKLDQNSVHLYTARFLKTSVGNYFLAVDWSQENSYSADAAMNPETAHVTNTNARVYQMVNVASEETTSAAPDTTVAPVADCCSTPSNLGGEWYWGRETANGQRTFYSKSTVSADGCTRTSQPYNGPTGTALTQLELSCKTSGQVIGDSFYVVDSLLGIYRCRSFISGGDLLFERISGLNIWTATSTPSECEAHLRSITGFRVELRLPLVSNSNPVTVPWPSEEIGKPLQASVKTSTAGANTCAGQSISTFTLTSNSIQMKLCQSTSIPATGIDGTIVDMRVIRSWNASDMGSLGVNNLGTFLLLALNNPTQLAANTPHLFTARFLKIGDGAYSLAVNWVEEGYFPVDVTMNPKVFSTDANVRVYDLEEQMSSSTSQLVTDPSATQDSALKPTDTTAMLSEAVTATQTDLMSSVMPSDNTASVMPSDNTASVMLSDNTASVIPTGSMAASLEPSASAMPTTSMGSDANVGSTGSVMPSGAQTSGVPPTVDASNTPAASQSMAGQSTATEEQTTMGTGASSAQETTGTIQPAPTSAPVTQDTSSPTGGIQPTTTSGTPDSTAAVESQVGVGVVTVDGDFNTITGGDAANFCQQTEPQIALKANVTQNRVDNVECVRGSVKITTHISEGKQDEITIAEALENLKAAVEGGFMITGPDGQQHPVNQNSFEQFIRQSDGSVICRGSTCIGTTSGDDDNKNVLIYCLVGVGLLIIIVTIIAVVVCATKRQEPSSRRKMPFREEDGFGMVKQWQANYKLSLKR